MTCNGNQTEYCGGGGRLNLYQYGAGASATSAAASPTATVINPTPTGPAIVPYVGGFSFLGCYTEATGNRALSGQTTASNTMTLETCQAYCAAYTYFGVEYGQEVCEVEAPCHQLLNECSAIVVIPSMMAPSWPLTRVIAISSALAMLANIAGRETAWKCTRKGRRGHHLPLRRGALLGPRRLLLLLRRVRPQTCPMAGRMLDALRRGHPEEPYRINNPTARPTQMRSAWPLAFRRATLLRVWSTQPSAIVPMPCTTAQLLLQTISVA